MRRRARTRVEVMEWKKTKSMSATENLRAIPNVILQTDGWGFFQHARPIVLGRGVQHDLLTDSPLLVFSPSSPPPSQQPDLFAVHTPYLDSRGRQAIWDIVLVICSHNAP